MRTTCTTIAIVDDDGGVRTALRGLLRSMGFDAVTFGSAEELLASIRREQIDCLIADIHLPGMSGVALLTALAGLGAALPAVLITASDDPPTLGLIHSAGAVPYLTKPFSDDELLAALRRALPD